MPQRKLSHERVREPEDLCIELPLGLSEVFEALKQISSGNPEPRVSEESNLELISKLKHLVAVVSDTGEGISTTRGAQR